MASTARAARKPVKVCVRTRPTANFAQDEILIEPEKKSITVDPHQELDETGPNNKSSSFRFQFHHVLHNASQETVYETLTRDVVQDVVNGINGTIMSYGQTGSGKTFTMMGDMSNYAHRGVAPRSLAHVFQEVNMRVETAFHITCSYMEIYNEKIFDLLADADVERTADYTIAEEKNGRGIFVRGLTEVAVTTEQDALNLLFSGELGRTTAQHKLNRQSNRSHSIFSVYVQQQSRSGVSERVISSKLHLVDLAGSERLKKTMEMDSGAPLDETLKKESMYINQSLTYLEQCVVALAKKEQGHVPYRQTKLTNVLKDALGGNCNTLLFACMWGESAHLEETISTLRLASRMMRVQNSTSAVEVVDPVKMVRKQERTIKELKQELLMHDALADRSGVTYDPYTPEQQMELVANLSNYLKAGEDDEDELLEFKSVREMKEICKTFKGMLREQQGELQRAMTSGGTGTGALGETIPPGSLSMGLPTLGGTTRPGEGPAPEGAVGDSEDVGGFALGVASDHARPLTTDAPRGIDRGGAGASGSAKDAGASGGAATGPRFGGSSIDLTDRDRAYAHYKNGEGKSRAGELATSKEALRTARAKSKQISQMVNDSKADIDSLEAQIAEKKAARLASKSPADGGDMEDVVDEEEFVLMKREREAKKTYRSAYEALRTTRAEIEDVTGKCDKIKYTLVTEFEEWHAAVLAQDMSPRGAAAGDDDDGEKLDDQEQFDKMEVERVVARDPDEFAYFQAQKTRRANQTQQRTALRQMHKNKRAS